MMSGVCYKGKMKKKSLRFIQRFQRDFIFILVFPIDMLVHQHGALLKSAGWVVFYLHGFMESLKHLFRSDSPAQYKDISRGSASRLSVQRTDVGAGK